MKRILLSTLCFIFINNICFAQKVYPNKEKAIKQHITLNINKDISDQQKFISVESIPSVISSGTKLLINYLNNRNLKFVVQNTIVKSADSLFEDSEPELPYLEYRSEGYMPDVNIKPLLSFKLEPETSADNLAFRYLLNDFKLENTMVKSKSNDVFEIKIKVGLKYIILEKKEHKVIDLGFQTVELDYVKFNESQKGVSSWFVSPYLKEGKSKNGGAYEVSVEVVEVNKRKAKSKKVIEYLEKNTEPLNELIKLIAEKE